MQKIDPAVTKERTKKLVKMRKVRDKKVHREALKKLEKVSKGDKNLMPPIIAALKAGATLGEISDCFRGVFGTFE